VKIHAKFACIFAENRNHIWHMVYAVSKDKQVEMPAAPQPLQSDPYCLRKCVATAVLSVVGITVGIALFFTGIISPVIFVPMLIISIACLAAAIFFFRKNRSQPKDAHETPPQVSSQDPKVPPPNYPGNKSRPGFHVLPPLGPLPEMDWNFSWSADPVREERAQNIARELYAWGDPSNVELWLRQGLCRNDSCGNIQIFLALQEKYPDFANEVLTAANESGKNAISVLSKLSNSDDEVCDGVLEDWAALTTLDEQVRIYERAKVVNPDLAERMRMRMKDDASFRLYLTVMAASKEPSEAAKMVMDEDGKLTDTGGEILLRLPAAVAAKIFMVILSSQGDGGDAQWKFVSDKKWFPWLLCGMEPKKAADVLLAIGHYAVSSYNYSTCLLRTFIEFMRFNPEATAHILAYMPQKAIESICLDTKCSAAVFAAVTPFLQQFNHQLAAQLFPKSLQDALNEDSLNELNVSRLFSMEPKEIVSVLQLLGNNIRINPLKRMTKNSSAAQMQKVVQVLEVLLQKNLLSHKEAGKFIYGGTEFRGRSSWPDFDCNALRQAFVQNLSDDTFARICYADQHDLQEEFLLTLPEERRERVKILIDSLQNPP
jgi:hypothetical protein